MAVLNSLLLERPAFISPPQQTTDGRRRPGVRAGLPPPTRPPHLSPHHQPAAPPKRSPSWRPEEAVVSTASCCFHFFLSFCCDKTECVLCDTWLGGGGGVGWCLVAGGGVDGDWGGGVDGGGGCSPLGRAHFFTLAPPPVRRVKDGQNR